MHPPYRKNSKWVCPINSKVFTSLFVDVAPEFHWDFICIRLCLCFKCFASLLHKVFGFSSVILKNLIFTRDSASKGVF